MVKLAKKNAKPPIRNVIKHRKNAVKLNRNVRRKKAKSDSDKAS